jgi:hypothetical protein
VAQLVNATKRPSVEIATPYNECQSACAPWESTLTRVVVA